jgi:hypothetical protein
VGSFAGVAKDEAAIRAAMSLPWSNGQTEGQITKLKLVKGQMYGRQRLISSRLVLSADLNCTKSAPEPNWGADRHQNRYEGSVSQLSASAGARKKMTRHRAWPFRSWLGLFVMFECLIQFTRCAPQSRCADYGFAVGLQPVIHFPETGIRKLAMGITCRINAEECLLSCSAPVVAGLEEASRARRADQARWFDHRFGICSSRRIGPVVLSGVACLFLTRWFDYRRGICLSGRIGPAFLSGVTRLCWYF